MQSDNDAVMAVAEIFARWRHRSRRDAEAQPSALVWVRRRDAALPRVARLRRDAPVSGAVGHWLRPARVGQQRNFLHRVRAVECGFRVFDVRQWRRRRRHRRRWRVRLDRRLAAVVQMIRLKDWTADYWISFERVGNWQPKYQQAIKFRKLMSAQLTLKTPTKLNPWADHAF